MPFLRLTLSKEIVIVLCIKLLIIFALKWAYFSDPVPVQDGPTAIDQQFFGITQATEADHDR